MATQRVTDVNGWFEVKRNPLSRVGVFPYSGRSVGLDGPDASRTIRVYRPESELSDPECLESFKLVPWVDDHTLLGPNEGQTPAEVKGVQGVIGEEVFYDSGVLYGNIKAFSNSLARLIEAGKKQLSAGYRCVYDWTAGTFNGQPYDCVQRKIRGNHLALVNEGRMGPSVAVMDSLIFSFDASEAIMAGENKDGGAESMTLADAIKMLGEIAPQVASLTAAVAKLGAPADDPAAVIDGAKPAAAATPPAAVVPPVAATPDAATPVANAAMDAALKPVRAELAKIGTTLAALDAAFKGAPTMASVMGEVAARDKLADRLAGVVGTFDAKDKTLQAVAVYGCEKLGLKPPAGAELVAVESYLSASEKKPAVGVKTGMDAANAPGADNFVTRHLTAQAAK